MLLIRTPSSGLLAVLLLALVAGACADYYISPIGSDSNSGTSAQDPFLTLSKALAASASNDTINAAAGVYKGDANVGLSISDRSVRGSDESSCVFQGSNSTLFQLSGSVLLSGLTLEGGEPRPVGLESMSGSSVVLADITFADLSIGVDLASTIGSLSLQSCSAGEDVGSALYGRSDDEVWIEWGDILIEDCVFSTSYAAVNISLSGPHGSVETVTVRSTQFVNSGFYYRAAVGPPSGLIEGSSFTDCSTPLSAVELHIGTNFTISDSVFLGNSNDDYAPVLIASFDTHNYTVTALVDSCYFSDNSGRVGAIVATNGYLTIVDSTFERNTGEECGAVASYESYDTTISGSLFHSNQALGGSGGAFLAYNGRHFRIADSVFDSNSALENGGGASSSVRDFVAKNLTFVGNQAGGQGGGWYSRSKGILAAVTFTSNVAAYGGGLYGSNGSPQLFRDCVFDSNVAHVSAGAVELELENDSSHALFFFSNATMTGNKAQRGGAINVKGGSPFLVVKESNLSNNSASLSGGAIYCSSGQVKLSNSTLTDNQSPEGSAYTCSGSCAVSETGSAISGTVGGCANGTLPDAS